ncbi:hypothetical protein BS47DRAFT_1450334 [Hydnum rufescens UP504]|uniref:Uncharacterized protein n=1 Tax=Hydnum rufescens UP504 TaxID=1448309 RepID=A0A9P6AZV5_9AGAM|nr:hypothetical protein BS47DRAFT_1450334 [Hydnum rufescens UP504]
MSEHQDLSRVARLLEAKHGFHRLEPPFASLSSPSALLGTTVMALMFMESILEYMPPTSPSLAVCPGAPRLVVMPVRMGMGHFLYAISATYRLATCAKGIAIKVLSDTGSGYTSDIISGVNLAYQSAKSSSLPSVINMSLGSGLSTALNTAVSIAISGAFISPSQHHGNSNVNAKTTSAASSYTASPIGAIDSSQNVKASFSNYGTVLDVWAPGVNILSAFIWWRNHYCPLVRNLYESLPLSLESMLLSGGYIGQMLPLGFSIVHSLLGPSLVWLQLQSI